MLGIVCRGQVIEGLLEEVEGKGYEILHVPRHPLFAKREREREAYREECPEGLTCAHPGCDTIIRTERWANGEVFCERCDRKRGGLGFCESEARHDLYLLGVRTQDESCLQCWKDRGGPERAVEQVLRKKYGPGPAGTHAVPQLRRLRAESGMGAKRLGAIIGVAEASVHRYENCTQRAPAEVRERICAYFDVTEEELTREDLDTHD